MQNPPSYSLHGQLTNEVQNGTAIARTYDALNRPTGYSLLSHALNGVENIELPLRGPLKNVSTPSTTSYSYDALGRLAAVDLNAEAQSCGVGFEYSYLSNTDLISGKTATLGNHSPFTILHSTFEWDGWNIIRETATDGSGSTTVTDNVWGLDLDGTLQGAGGVGGLLAVVRDDGVFLPTYDANGNVSEYVSEDGSIVAHYDYSPFGETLIESGDLASAFTHRFSTKPWCPVTGLCEYQMRKYRPGIGRWLSRDPIGEKSDELSIYAYLGNSSLAGSDYLGLMWNFRLIRLPSRPPAKTKKRPCCGDTTYDPETECCLEEEYDDGEELALGIGEVREGPTPMEELPRKTRFVVRKNTPIGTGVFKGKWEGAYNGRRNVVHYWISWPGGSVDANALDDKIVHSPALRAYSRFDQGVKLTEVKLSPCLYDIEVYITCIKRQVEFWRGKEYNGMCYDFVAFVCSFCEQEARR